MKMIYTLLTVLMITITASAATAAGGHYIGGRGSSHKGGHYSNPSTGNHYQHRR